MTEPTGKPGSPLRETLALVAPGTVLRDGLERILRGRTGAIIVLGYDEMVESISSGGFNLDVELSAARLRELAKMDGGVVVDRTAGRIRRANVQLLPHAPLETADAGVLRHACGSCPGGRRGAQRSALSVTASRSAPQGRAVLTSSD